MLRVFCRQHIRKKSLKTIKKKIKESSAFNSTFLKVMKITVELLLKLLVICSHLSIDLLQERRNEKRKNIGKVTTPPGPDLKLD